MKSKIAILGRGNAGCLSALHFSHYSGIHTNYEVELYYDPNIKPVPTGQGYQLDTPELLWKTLGIDWVKKFPFTQKTGIMYENWGKLKDTFFHPFPFGMYSLHCTPKHFQDFVCDTLKVNFKETSEHIINYDDVDADYIIDCRGTPKDFTNYDKLVNPLNSALLANLPKKENDVLFTRCIATPNGWTFYIPLPDTTSIGYLYNSAITSREDAEKDFKERFGVEKINHHISFSQYLAKQPILENRIFLNGNKLFFLEPLEASAMGSYTNANRRYFDVINKISPPSEAESSVRSYMKKVENFILWHYLKGSKYKTSFWGYAQDLANTNLSNSFKNRVEDIINFNENEKKYIRDAESPELHYGQWHYMSFQNWIDNVGMENV
tara:strand:+ start:127 stop:1263 length:1137 start_codon:yes stop_codon:yes gene_type:complete